LGELIGEKAGVLNIGLEGIMLAATAGGVLLSAIFALLTINLKADAIVAGTGLNLFALSLTGVAHRALAGNIRLPSKPPAPMLGNCAG